MTALTGRDPADTYGDILRFENSGAGLTTTLKAVQDGRGTAGPFEVSTTTLNITGTLQKGGTSITATAAEINYNAGVTPGTAAASKTLMAGANKNLDTLAIADGGLKLGAGAGTAVTATATELNQIIINCDIADGSADTSYFVPVGHAGTVSKIYTVIDGSVSTADITITPKIGGTGLTDGVITIATAGSAAGDKDESTPSANNTFDSPGGALELAVTGGGSGGSPRIHVAIVLTR